MLSHKKGHVMTKNENEDCPIVVFNAVNTSGNIAGIIGKYIETEMTNTRTHGLYRAKCQLMQKGIGERGDVQNICLFADYDFMLVNAFIMYNNAEPAVDEHALIKALTAIKQAFPTYTVRIPNKLGYKDMTAGEWNIIFYRIMNILVNHGINVEIWHNT